MQKRKLTKIFVAVTGGLFAVNAFAIGPGLYMGLMMGPASNDANPQPVQIKFAGGIPIPSPQATTTAPISTFTQIGNPKSTQFGSRAYLGYKFNAYAGFELGFTYFSGINFILSQNPSTVSSTGPVTGGFTPMTPYQAAAGTTGRVRLVDLLGKLDYSYNDTIGLFVKAGVAAAYVTVPGGLQPTSISWQPAPVTASNPTGTKLVTTGSNKYLSKLAPAFAIGASYDLNQSWQVDVSWTRYFVGSQIKSMNLYALGLSYHFVDVYCGSFLCGE